MEKIIFTKMSGAGNDFVFIDEIENPDLNISSEIIKNLCDRKNGIGSDGLILFKDNKDYDFEMVYFNSDGTTNTLCGNGARCAIKYAKDTDRIKNTSAKFLSNDIIYTGEVIEPEIIRFDFNTPKKIKTNFKIKASGQLINAHYADTGSPHVIIKIDEVLEDLEKPFSNYDQILEFPVYQLGKEIRNLPEFFPGGTNVNFIKIVGKSIIIRTYERGVENETLACGTGSVASALIENIVDGLEAPVKLITKSGEHLIVDFKKNNNIFEKVSLTGSAKTIFTGEFYLNL